MPRRPLRFAGRRTARGGRAGGGADAGRVAGAGGAACRARARDRPSSGRARKDTDSELSAARDAAAAAKQAARHAADRAEADRQRLAAVERQLDEALFKAADAERQRDELLSARAERAGIEVSPAQLIELRGLASSARTMADRLAALIAVPSSSPQAGCAARQHGARLAAGDRVPADGARRARAHRRLQRRQADVAGPVVGRATRSHARRGRHDRRRYGAEIAVIFDGADVVGAHAAQRRLARVRYSHAGITADDVIRAEVSSLDPARPVVVVTNDGAIRRDVAAAGANLIASGAFADLALS